MADFLSLRGRTALSPFRLAKLRSALTAAHPDHRIESLAATFWHFAEIARPLTPGERDRLERLLDYGPHDDDAPRGGERLVVVPRFGTISPWSSKATDIVHNCGLDAVVRVERGTVFTIATDGAPLTEGETAALLPLIHDRMIETVLDDVDDARALFTHVPPRPLTSIRFNAVIS